MQTIVEFQTKHQMPYAGLVIGLATTPVGSAVLAWDDLGLRELNLHESLSDIPNQCSALGYSFDRDDRHAQSLVEAVFARQALGMPIVLCGTQFQLDVWRELLKLKFGETVSYGELANRIQKPTAARAVGAAVGANRLGFVVPCHRVVRHDRVIGQFRWGSDVKAKLLAWESLSVHE
ncbi:MAG: methylated-DNA--[protein]-cysteine S-methyltransferase [Burkholderiaceae bacterium]|nr:methylated-DNA--[protein]-cysteine S-methyltransferase [Burkholderiaceae bacterium]MCD8517663.1 methylated-DNA--[protein]-cysteine S-methyltransferase [Burkholderiaceae bacterium]